MATDQLEKTSLDAYCRDVALRAKAASAKLATVSGDVKTAWLRRSAELLRAGQHVLNEANQRDLQAAPAYGLTDAQVDRLRLTPERIEDIAAGLEQVAALRDPIGAVIDSTIRPNGLRIDKVRVPLGVVFFIYESRPNVTADAAAICAKGGNAVILRGGKEAIHSSSAIVELLAQAAEETGLPKDAVQLVATTDRDAVGQVPWHGGLHRRGHSARRRGSDPPRGRRGDHAGHQALRRQLPRLRRRVGRPGPWPRRSPSTASASGWASATRPSRWWSTPTSRPSAVPRLVKALDAQGIEIRGCSKVCELCPAPCPRPRRTTAPSTWAR